MNQGLPLEERLSRSYGKTCETSSELLECVHAPTVNPKSEQLVHERLLRQVSTERPCDQPRGGLLGGMPHLRESTSACRWRTDY